MTTSYTYEIAGFFFYWCLKTFLFYMTAESQTVICSLPPKQLCPPPRSEQSICVAEVKVPHLTCVKMLTLSCYANAFLFFWLIIVDWCNLLLASVSKLPVWETDDAILSRLCWRQSSPLGVSAKGSDKHQLQPSWSFEELIGRQPKYIKFVHMLAFQHTPVCILNLLGQIFIQIEMKA